MSCDAKRNFSKLPRKKKRQIPVKHAKGKTELSFKSS